MSEFSGRLVVLGGTGFVGSHVVARAGANGWEVIALSSSIVDLGAEIAIEELSGIIQDGDTVVHGAAVVPTRNATDIILNLQMTQHLVEALTNHTLAQLVVVSSDAVYGSASGVTTEESPAAPDSLHGVMSLAREMICADAGVPNLTLIRPTAIYGIGDTHNSYGPNRFVRQVIETGEITLFGLGEATRDHVAVNDVAEVIVQSVATRQHGVLNIACGKSISFANLAKEVQLCGPQGSRITTTGSESSPTFRAYDISGLIRRFPNLRMQDASSGVGSFFR